MAERIGTRRKIMRAAAGNCIAAVLSAAKGKIIIGSAARKGRRQGAASRITPYVFRRASCHTPLSSAGTANTTNGIR